MARPAMVTQLALGVRGMLIDAVARHRREFQGELPRCIRMHPAVFADWVANIDMHGRHEFTFDADGTERWLTIRVERLQRVQGIQIITANNVIESL